MALIPLLALGGCAAEPPTTGEPAAEWRGTIETEGDVTTVVNESGSVWGGPARLVEEASIGVEAGEDAYMLGRVRALAATDDRIYVVDLQVPAVRVYDWGGTHVRDVGREGEGPGEYQYPTAVDIDGEGRVWVHEQPALRLVVFTPDGEPLTTLTLGGTRISGNAESMVVTPDGVAYVVDVIFPEDPGDEEASSRVVMQPYGLDGERGEPIELPRFGDSVFLEARNSGTVRFQNVPFHPNGTTAFTSSRAVLSGYSDTYRFQIDRADGTRTVIERAWEPLSVQPDEAAAHERAATEYMRDMDPGWGWSGPPVPSTKPAFSRLVPAETGETWVVRPGPGARLPDCDPESFEPDGDPPCWEEERIVDVFGADGRYLGEIDVPDEAVFETEPVIRGRDVVARVEDEMGTVMVKRYRIDAPDGG